MNEKHLNKYFFLDNTHKYIFHSTHTFVVSNIVWKKKNIQNNIFHFSQMTVFDIRHTFFEKVIVSEQQQSSGTLIEVVFFYIIFLLCII